MEKITFKKIIDSGDSRPMNGFKFVGTREIDEDAYKALYSDSDFYSLERRIESDKDDFWDGYESICDGSDGKIYCVLFNDGVPCIWCEVEKE